MIQGRKDVCLTLEACNALRIVAEPVRNDLDGDVASEPGIACAIDLAHSASPQSGLNIVRAEASAGSQRQGCSTRIIRAQTGVLSPRSRERYVVIRLREWCKECDLGRPWCAAVSAYFTHGSSDFRAFRTGMFLAMSGETARQPHMTTMVGLTEEQRRMLIDKLPDAANLALGARVFGQFLGGRPFSSAVAVLGIVTWAVLLACAFVIGGGQKP